MCAGTSGYAAAFFSASGPALSQEVAGGKNQCSISLRSEHVVVID
jgi:hypothetical protein